MDSSTTPADDVNMPMHESETDDELSDEGLDGSEAPVAGSERPRKRATRSHVWKNFTRHETLTDKATCNYCGKIYSCRTLSGTSNLRKHGKSCRQKAVWESQKGQQQAITPEGKLKMAKVSEMTFREATNKLIVMCELPLSFIESAGWRHFCSTITLYTPHSRRTATRDIIKMFTSKRDMMKENFNRVNQRVSITTDIWTAPTTGSSYMVVTAHFIDEQWILRKLVIGFKNVVDHKAETIAIVLLNCLAEWGIQKVFTVTVDNATANTLALKKFVGLFKELGDNALVLGGEYLHMRCAAHILNLVVRDGMHDVNKSVVAVRNSVHYVRSSTNRLLSFEQKIEVGQNVSRGSLSLDCKTRWNSTYLMLSNALTYKSAFDRMEAEDKLYFDYFMQTDAAGNTRDGPPNADDWEEIDRLVQFLHVFYESTLVVSASSSLNAHKAYSEICTIEENLIRLSKEPDVQLQSKAMEMKAKFEKYWNGLNEINQLLIVASVLDPTKKMQFAEMCFDGLYGEGSHVGKEIAACVYDVMKRLFEEYKSCIDPPHNSEPLTPGSRASSSQSYQSKSTITSSSSKSDFAVKGYTRLEKRYHEKQTKKVLEEASNELDLYLREPVETPHNVSLGFDYDVLGWWRLNQRKFPILAVVAKDVLALQVSSVASESAFSTSGRILDPYRSCITHKTLEVLMCTEQWLHADLKMTRKDNINALESLADAELQDDLQKEFNL